MSETDPIRARGPAASAAQRGSALIMVVLLGLIISAVGGTMLIMSNSDHKIAANERDSERALQASRSGLSYAYDLFQKGLLTPSETGAAFDSFTTAVGGPLEGGEFTGLFYDLSSTMNQGQLYRIEATGAFNRAARTTELTFQVIPDAFKFGYMAFSEMKLHNHSGVAQSVFKIQSTGMSNGNVELPQNITFEGSIVAGAKVTIDNNATVTRDIYANQVANSGTIQGTVRLLSSVDEVPSSETTWDIKDASGTKYDWWVSATPGSLSGNAPVGGVSSYTIQEGDEFRYDIFNRNGVLLSDPEINVVAYVDPPKLDYQAMKAEALKNDNTYFATEEAFVNYLLTKKVNETVGGKNVITIKVGTPSAPEFIYIDDDLQLDINPANTDSPSSGKIKADGLFIEGGIYISGDFDFDGPDFQAASPQYPLPPDYYMLKINGLPYCYPSLMAYNEPSIGTIDTWTPDDTPPLGSGSKINMSGGSEGPSFFNGVVYAQSEIHFHHTSDPREVIRFNGAELADVVHNCDFFWFSYDPQVRCTRFLVTSQGRPEIVAFHEVR